MRKRTIHTSQRAMAYVLLMSQLLTSCGGFNEIVFDKRQVPIPQPVPVEKLATEEVGQAFLSSYGPYTLKNGDQVTFIECDGILMAQVKELLPPGFKREPFTLPVHLQRGVGMQEIDSRSYIRITLPNKKTNESGYVVCASQAGLLGGMPPKHADCKYNGDQYKQNSNGDWVCPSGKHTVKENPSKKPPTKNTTSSSSQSYNPLRRDNLSQSNTSANSNLFAEFDKNRMNRAREDIEREEREKRERENGAERERELKELKKQTEAILEQMVKDGKEAAESYVRYKKELKELDKQFVKEKAEEALKTEEERQATFKKDREEWKKLCEDELASGVANRNKVKRGEARGDIQLITLWRADINVDTVKKYRRDVNEFREDLTATNKSGLTDEQKDDIVTLLKASDNLYRELLETKENLTYLLAHPDPDITCATSERLQLAEKLLEDLKQQRADIAQILSKQGDDISNYGATPEGPKPPAETDENTQANKDLFLKVSDPSDAKTLVTAIEQQMRKMIADNAPLPTTRATFKPTASVEEQAQALAKQAYMLRSILSAIEGMLQDAYFGESMNDYIDRSTEEGVEKIRSIQAAIDQLEEIDELFKARFHVGGGSPGIVNPTRLTQSYINDLVNALVDQGEKQQHTPANGDSSSQPTSWLSSLFNRFSSSASSSQPTGAGSGKQQTSASASSSKPPETNKSPEKPKEEPKSETEKITQEVNKYLESHSKGGASKAEGGDLLTRTEALKKETKASYRRIDSLIDSDEPNAGLFMEQALQKKKDLNQLRGLRKQLKETCKFSKEELDGCKVRLIKPNEGDDGMQTDSSCEDGISREDWAFNKGALKGIGKGMIAAMKGSVEGLYHLATSPVATIEGFVEFLENIDELPGLLAASLEELEGMDPEQQGEAIAKFITEQVFTFAAPPSKVKLLQQASKAKLGAAAVKVGKKAGNIKYYSAEELARRLGVSKDKIHGIKKTILKDLEKDFKKEIERLGATNPDIYIDGSGNIVLKNLQTKKTLITSTPLDSYRP